MQLTFNKLARVITGLAGSPITTLIAFVIIIAWFVGGFIIGFSDTYQLYINTCTTIVTFLMVFLIQNAQNRDSVALQLKLDELIRSHEGAHNALLDLEELTERELDHFRTRYEELASLARAELKKGAVDTSVVEVRQ
jgi:low affinity Fe/Cu permease